MSPGPCGLFVGFLLPRPCENAAIGTCVKCSREVCEAHATVAQSGLLCRACESGSELPLALAGAAAGAVAAAGLAPLFLPADLEAFDAAALEDGGEDDAFADLS